MTTWLTQKMVLPTKFVLTLLDVHSEIDSVLVDLACLHRFYFTEDAEEFQIVGDPAAVLNKLNAKLEDVDNALLKAPLTVSVPHLRCWVSSAIVFAGGLQRFEVHRLIRILDASTTRVVSNCPDWSECISDTHFNSSAVALFLKDGGLTSLPEAITELHGKIEMLSEGVTHLKLPDGMQHPTVAKSVAKANTALEFGTLTIIVAAVGKLVLANMKKVIEGHRARAQAFKSHPCMPAKLVEMLTEIQNGNVPQMKFTPTAPKKRAQPSNAWGHKRFRGKTEAAAPIE